MLLKSKIGVTVLVDAGKYLISIDLSYGAAWTAAPGWVYSVRTIENGLLYTGGPFATLEDAYNDALKRTAPDLEPFCKICKGFDTPAEAYTLVVEPHLVLFPTADAVVALFAA